MPASSNSKPTLVFFGATGGCTLAALSRALKAGYDCSALVRTPEKLSKLLLDRSISQETQNEHLVVHEGNVKDSAAVKKALLQRDGNTVRSIITFGVGGKMDLSCPFKPTLDDPHITEQGITAVLSALAEIRAESGSEYIPPLLTAISSSGLSGNAKRDVPLAMIPLYHWMLSVPHADKKRLEECIEGVPGGLLDGWVIIRPSLLVDGEALGESKVRAGYEFKKMEPGAGSWGGQKGIAVGYTISREDVGGFIFQECIENRGKEWLGRKVTLTY